MGLFYELWSFLLSIDFQLDSCQVIGWASLTVFFSLKPPQRLGIIVLLKCSPLFHLHHSGRWQQICVCNMMDLKNSNLVSSDQAIFSQYFKGLSKCSAANFKYVSTFIFFSNWVFHGKFHTGHSSWQHCWLFSLKEFSTSALHKWSLALGQFLWLFVSLLCQKCSEEQLVVAGLWWN